MNIIKQTVEILLSNMTKTIITLKVAMNRRMVMHQQTNPTHRNMNGNFFSFQLRMYNFIFNDLAYQKTTTYKERT